MDSSVDVCDLMINLLCTDCPDRACAESDYIDHSKLMNCIRRHVSVRPWLVWVKSDIISTFNNLVENTDMVVPEGFKVEENIDEIIAELPIDTMTTSTNELLYDEILDYMGQLDVCDACGKVPVERVEIVDGQVWEGGRFLCAECREVPS